jgi:hypothetical protein
MSHRNHDGGDEEYFDEKSDEEDYINNNNNENATVDGLVKHPEYCWNVQRKQSWNQPKKENWSHADNGQLYILPYAWKKRSQSTN